MLKFKFLFSLTVIAAMLFFTACNKDLPIASMTTARIKTETTTSPSGVALTFAYTYDSAGRQLTATMDTVVTVYTYATGGITKTITLAGQNFVTTYTINTVGKVITDSRNYVYSYDINGYRTAMTYTGNGNYDSTLYTITNGNLTTAIQHQVDAGTDNLLTTVYTYYSTIDSRDYGMAALQGSPNNNLLKTETIVQQINGATYTSAYDYTYSFNAQGLISQQVRTSGSASYTTNYVY